MKKDRGFECCHRGCSVVQEGAVVRGCLFVDAFIWTPFRGRSFAGALLWIPFRGRLFMDAFSWTTLCGRFHKLLSVDAFLRTPFHERPNVDAFLNSFLWTPFCGHIFACALMWIPFRRRLFVDAFSWTPLRLFCRERTYFKIRDVSCHIIPSGCGCVSYHLLTCHWVDVIIICYPIVLCDLCLSPPRAPFFPFSRSNHI